MRFYGFYACIDLVRCCAYSRLYGVQAGCEPRHLRTCTCSACIYFRKLAMQDMASYTYGVIMGAHPAQGDVALSAAYLCELVMGA